MAIKGETIVRKRDDISFTRMLTVVLQIYFALVLYSYAIHLRHGTYRKLPLSKPSGYSQQNGTYRPVRGQSFELGNVDDEDLPAWSEGEDEEESAGGGQARIPNSNKVKSETLSASSAGSDIIRPQSRNTGRRNSNFPPVKEGTSSERLDHEA